MGLSVCVGVLPYLLEHEPEMAADFSNELEIINHYLVSCALPSHIEPTEPVPGSSRAVYTQFPYSFLHHLRRVYAHVRTDSTWIATPVNDSEDPTQDPLVVDLSLEFDSHLLVHSDCEGYYLPIEFPEPLFVGDELTGGGMVGSSFGLMSELVQVSGSLGVVLDSSILSNEEASRLQKSIDSQEPLYIELMVWFCLYEAARLSLQYRTAIVYN
ncbi:MAG: hypothetical protein BWY75_01759 [bacterium ADurb.Bin425]|nr:MAG: hypothetical protein BWY75_01759 [bacterium ADurb.Bin425]